MREFRYSCTATNSGIQGVLFLHCTRSMLAQAEQEVFSWVCTGGFLSAPVTLGRSCGRARFVLDVRKTSSKTLSFAHSQNVYLVYSILTQAQKSGAAKSKSVPAIWLYV